MSVEDGSQSVLIGVHGVVATVTLNRPERLNALTGEMTSRYITALRDLDADDAVRAIIVTGAGRGFCAGADREGLAVLDIEDVRRQAEDYPRDTPMRMSTPIIAAINGAVAGVGLAHALMADIRFTTPEAKWTTAFAKLGLVAEVGTSWNLVREVGPGRALDLLLSSRVFTGRKAFEMGLAQFLCEPGDLITEVTAYAEAIAANSPRSIQAMRQQVYGDASKPWETAWSDTYERVFQALATGELQQRLVAQQSGDAAT